ncbi:MAG: hypothetical protein KJ607_06360, partial [Bacteroidetes bacterium]|nr:hypothetical protein [Bacteroidota bacterium]
QDFISPFFIYLKSVVRTTCTGIDDTLNPSRAKLETVVENKAGRKKKMHSTMDIEINKAGLFRITIQKGKQTITAERTDDR